MLTRSETSGILSKLSGASRSASGADKKLPEKFKKCLTNANSSDILIKLFTEGSESWTSAGKNLKKFEEST